MNPIDYTTQVKSPFESALTGVQAGFQIGANLDQAQLKEMQVQQAARLQQSQSQMQSDLNALSNNKNATGSDYAAVMTRYPQLSEQLTKSLAAHTSAQHESVVKDAGQVFAALHSGKPEIAQQVLTEKALAYRNSGDETRAKGLEALNKSISINPKSAQTSIGILLGQAMGPEKFGSMLTSIGKEGRDVELFPAQQAEAESAAKIKAAEAANIAKKLGLDNANTESLIKDRAQKLGLDRDRLKSEMQLKMYELGLQNANLPEFVAKDVSAAVTDSISSQQSAQQMLALAEKIDKFASELGSGKSGQVGEWWKKIFGTQNELTRIRSEYSRIVTPAAMAIYKKVASGSTSDKDIETAMVGVPPDNASPETMSAFVRGAAKLQTYDSALNNAKSEWLANVKHLGKSKKDIQIGSVEVPAGTTFKEFADKFVSEKFGAAASTESVKPVPAQRSYMSVVN